MISCKEAAIICNKSQYREASFIEKLKLELHILMCKACNQYVKKNTKLTNLCRKAPLKGLTEAEKEAIKENIAKYH